MLTHLQFHPVTEIFPPMEPAVFQALVDDIAVHGQQDPILVLKGEIIDGRHRYQACQQLGREPLLREIQLNAGDPLALVISLNLHRRHLSEGQRAIIAARLATLPHGRPDANAQICAFTQDEAAQHLKVSRRTVQHARAVLDHGIDELQAAVKGGEISVSAAAELSRLPADTQRAALTKTPEEIRAIAREVKARIKEAGVCGPSAVKIFEQLAADLLEKPTDEQLKGTAFHRNTMTNNEGGTNDEEWRIAAIVDNWAKGCTFERAHALGLRADASYEAIIEQYIEDCKTRPGYPVEALNGLK